MVLGAVGTKGAVGQQKAPREQQPWAVPANRPCRLLVSYVHWAFRKGWGHRQGQGVKLVGGQGRRLLPRGMGSCRAGQQDGCPSPRGDVRAGRAAGSIACGLTMLQALAWLPLLAGLMGGLVPPCHPLPMWGAGRDICPGQQGCAVGLQQCCCCHAGPWELGGAAASCKCPAPGEPLSCPWVAGGYPQPQPDSHGPPGPLGTAPGPWHPPRHPLTRNALQGATKNVKI